jgi:hypothetical protein
VTRSVHDGDADRRISRSGVMLAGSLGVAASLTPALRGRGAAQEATPAASLAARDEPAGAADGLSAEIIEAFGPVPGTKALHVWAPPDAGRPAWSVSLDADQELFIASAFKVFVLAEYLRQAEDALDPTSDTPLSVQLNSQLAEEWTLDEAVFSPALRSSIRQTSRAR